MELSGESDSREVDFGSLLTSGKFSDLKLLCEGREFAVHKAILCTQSRVISAACEGNFEESRTNVIKIEEFDADTVQRMLEFLYSGDYFGSSRPISSTHDAEGSENGHSQGKSKPQNTYYGMKSHELQTPKTNPPRSLLPS
ncbi:hypothetical protein Daus18300_013179 [Diaporthe australafricana]|uniref:BTB domain-containing protein n=1 Tax=Diaporthe australafricana TaxID=127596 RepID=A0ABR3W041_9PEZI